MQAADVLSDAKLAAPAPLIRKRQYRASILRGDFFVLRHLKSFLESTLSASVKPGVRVADVGCGEQPFRSLIEKLGGSYTGIDIAQNSAGSVDIVAGIDSIPLPTASFDLVLCSEVLEHVSDTTAAFAELARLCRIGGSIVLTTPFAYPLHEEPHDFVRLTPYQIRDCARARDLEVAQLETAGNELEVIATVWCNLWTRTNLGLPRTVRSAWNALMRLPLNGLVSLLSPALHRLLPRKYFLSTLCVLVKRG
jgi:SAM-dependent methyltransferase